MIGRAYGWEIRKLLRQKRTFAGLIAAVIYALAFVVVLRLRSDAALPPDIPLASQVKDTAAVLPLALLSFATFFGAPVIAFLMYAVKLARSGSEMIPPQCGIATRDEVASARGASSGQDR